MATGLIHIHAVSGKVIVADIGTKSLTQQRIKALLYRSGVLSGQFARVGEQEWLLLNGETDFKKLIRVIKKGPSSLQKDAMRMVLLMHALSPLLSEAVSADGSDPNVPANTTDSTMSPMHEDSGFLQKVFDFRGSLECDV